MNQEIIDYLINEHQLNLHTAERIAQKVQKYDDIKAEFLHWLKVRHHNVENPVIVEGYTAAQIAELAPGLDGIGVYNFLSDMRDDPEYGKRTIQERFIVK